MTVAGKSARPERSFRDFAVCVLRTLFFFRGTRISANYRNICFGISSAIFEIAFVTADERHGKRFKTFFRFKVKVIFVFSLDFRLN